MKGILIHPTILKCLNTYLHTLDIIALIQLNKWTYYEWAFKPYMEVCFELEKRFSQRYYYFYFYRDEHIIIKNYRELMRDAYRDTGCVSCGKDDNFIDLNIKPHTTCEQCYLKDNVIFSWNCIEWDVPKGIKRSKWIRFWKRYFLRRGKPYLQCTNDLERWQLLQISEREYFETCYKGFKLIF